MESLYKNPQERGYKTNKAGFLSDDENSYPNKGKSSYIKFNETSNDWNQDTLGGLDKNHPFMNNLRRNQHNHRNPKSPD